MSNEKIYKLNEVKDLAKKYNYRLGECLDGSGQKVCTSSPLTSKPHIWVDKTLTPFTTRPNNNGIYYVYMYPDTQRKSKPDIYPIQVGKVPANAPINAPQVQPVIVQHLNENPQGNPLSWDSALAYQKEIADLKSENTKLTLQLAQAQKELAEFESDENLNEGASENKNFFADLLPVADQFMQNQKQARYLEFLRLASTNPAMLQHAHAFVPAGMQPMAQPAQNFSGIPKRQDNMPNEQIKKAQEFIDNLSDDDYSKVEAVKKTSSNLNALFENLAIAHPELYDQLEQFVNA